MSAIWTDDLVLCDCCNVPLAPDQEREAYRKEPTCVPRMFRWVREVLCRACYVKHVKKD